MQMPLQFDIYRIFFGDQFTWNLVAEILLRTIFLYCYALMNIRIIGKQGLTQLSPFQLIIIISLGSAIGDPMFYQNVPLIYGMIVISTIVSLERFTIWIMGKSLKMHKLVEGWPALLIKDGKIIHEELRRQRLSLSEFLEMLRLRGVKDTGQVEYAFLETSGNLSIILYGTPASNGDSTVDWVMKN